MQSAVQRMKVFLSWSGGKSHKVALVFRDWLPSVIQEIEPYVSSEDIDKGARWSTDIAKELEDSTFGILCVTRENINAPWLTFEAGALSKTMDKSLVSPFLFDIKRSEVDGPILQFQSTIFEREDVRKLVTTMNKACDGGKLSDERLAKAFEVWYPTLEGELNKLKETTTPEDDADESSLKDAHSQQILEEILDLSRINQKLLRSQDGPMAGAFMETREMIQELMERQKRSLHAPGRRSLRRFHPMMMEEIMMMIMEETLDKGIAAQMILAQVRDEMPWVYDAGMETLRAIKDRNQGSDSEAAIDSFLRIVEFSFRHPVMREQMERSKEWSLMMREFPHLLERAFRMAAEG